MIVENRVKLSRLLISTIIKYCCDKNADVVNDL